MRDRLARTRVEAASDPTRIGSDQVRGVRFEGERMVLIPPPRLTGESENTGRSPGNASRRSRSDQEPEVRIHLPPAESRVRTRLTSHSPRPSAASLRRSHCRITLTATSRRNRFMGWPRAWFRRGPRPAAERHGALRGATAGQSARHRRYGCQRAARPGVRSDACHACARRCPRTLRLYPPPCSLRGGYWT